MQELNNPIPPKYFIVWNIAADGSKHPISYGFVESNQLMSSGLHFIETFTDEALYLAALALLDIFPNL